MGRLLIPLYLLDKKVLDKPCFYISDFFERNREAYYEALDRARTTNDLIHWICLFLEATIYTAQNAKEKFKKVVALVSQYQNQVISMPGKSENNLSILRTFYEAPIQTGMDVVAKVSISKTTVDKALKEMLRLGILTEITGYSKFRKYMLNEYVKIFNQE